MVTPPMTTGFRKTTVMSALVVPMKANKMNTTPPPQGGGAYQQKYGSLEM